MTDSAEQINLGKIPLPPKLQEQVKVIPKTPDGWWSLNLDGAVNAVIAKLEDATTKVPAHWKSSIKTEALEKCGTAFNCVTILAQTVAQAGHTVLHISITPSNRLL